MGLFEVLDNCLERLKAFDCLKIRVPESWRVRGHGSDSKKVTELMSLGRQLAKAKERGEDEDKAVYC